MTLTAVAARYANALADVVTAPTAAISPQNAAAELRAFEAALESSQELREALATPAVPVGRKKAVIGRIADSLGISRVPRNFLYVLADHRRIGSLTPIIQQFEDVVDERLGFARADVASAERLSDSQRAALTTQLERLTGRKIRMHIEVDPALIGGAVARIGSTVYDGSVRGQLASLERRLTAES
jgi:F-type H+-transporting ATPase subunit delta